jgi:hypothetical protein
VAPARTVRDDAPRGHGRRGVKIEEPSRGDYARWLEPEVEPTDSGALFHAVNRNKKSVTLDLKADAGREAFLDLAAEADVVYEQFRPGVVDRLGVGYDDVRVVNEEIVYCSLSGYGQDGPYSDRVGHDINYVGVAGLLRDTVSKDGEFPAVPAYQIGDKVGGMFCAFAIVPALLDREAGIGPHDLDVVEVHDAATIGELMHYEGLGLASHGEGASLVRNGDVMLDGRIPVNPSGGLKSRGHPVGATGVAQVCELVWQLRGEAGDRQVEDPYPSIGLARNSGGALVGEGGVSSVTILGTR